MGGRLASLSVRIALAVTCAAFIASPVAAQRSPEVWSVPVSPPPTPSDQPADPNGTYYPGVTQQESRAGSGEVSLTYQFAYFNKAKSGASVVVPLGRIDSHSLYFEADYWLTDNLFVTAGIPYFTIRYRGPSPHDITLVDPDHGQIDDGHYHGDFQDFQFGARYLALDEEFKITPFTLITVPSHNYPTFSHAAVGQNLFKVELGTEVSYFPAFDDWYATVQTSRVFVEHILGYSVDYWKVNVEPGYYLSPDFAVHGSLMIKQGNGLSFPRDFPSTTDVKFFNHDKLLRGNYINIGAGFDWLLPGGRRLSFQYVQMIHSEDAHILRNGIQFTFGQSF